MHLTPTSREGEDHDNRDVMMSARIGHAVAMGSLATFASDPKRMRRRTLTSGNDLVAIVGVPQILVNICRRK